MARRDSRSAAGLGNALGLTAASAVVWGLAHVRAGRHRTGSLLLGGYALLVSALLAGAVTLAAGHRADVVRIVFRRTWLDVLTVAPLLLAAAWAAVIVRSYQVVRPPGLRAGPRAVAAVLVVALVASVCAPLSWFALDAYALRRTIGGLFPAAGVRPPGRTRLNVLVLGGDGAPHRPGVRTDSVTLASVDPATGDTLLVGLPRNLQRFPMPARLAARWPDGFTGYPGEEGLLNELYQDAENHPELEPGRPADRRGPALLKEVIAGLLGQPVDYYVMIDMAGFAKVVDAVGGVRVHITKPLPVGGDDEGRPPARWLLPGYRLLRGADALWYGRSRHADDDYARMARQKCLLKAIVDQIDPRTMPIRFPRIAAAMRDAVSTDLPARELPALLRLEARPEGRRPRLRSLSLVPPLIGATPYRPDVARLRRLTASALGGQPASGGPAPDRSASGTASLDDLCR